MLVSFKSIKGPVFDELEYTRTRRFYIKIAIQYFIADQEMTDV